MFKIYILNHMMHCIFNVNMIQKKACSFYFYIVLMPHFPKFFPLEIKVLNEEFGAFAEVVVDAVLLGLGG